MVAQITVTVQPPGNRKEDPNADRQNRLKKKKYFTKASTGRKAWKPMVKSNIENLTTQSRKGAGVYTLELDEEQVGLNEGKSNRCACRKGSGGWQGRKLAEDNWGE